MPSARAGSSICQCQWPWVRDQPPPGRRRWGQVRPSRRPVVVSRQPQRLKVDPFTHRLRDARRGAASGGGRSPLVAWSLHPRSPRGGIKSPVLAAGAGLSQQQESEQAGDRDDDAGAGPDQRCRELVGGGEPVRLGSADPEYRGGGGEGGGHAEGTDAFDAPHLGRSDAGSAVWTVGALLAVARWGCSVGFPWVLMIEVLLIVVRGLGFVGSMVVVRVGPVGGVGRVVGHRGW